jgi:hypothetical protein
MTGLRLILILVLTLTAVVGTIIALASCGDPSYKAPPIAVTFSTQFPPPTALEANATAGIAAVVSNGADSAEVSFSCMPAMQCGSFSPSTVASNIPVTYQAPPSVPSGGEVTVTATSVTDPTKSVSASITID